MHTSAEAYFLSTYLPPLQLLTIPQTIDAFNIPLITAGDRKRYLVSGYRRCSSILRCAQRFSMRFMSQELTSQSITVNLYSLAASLSQLHLSGPFPVHVF